MPITLTPELERLVNEQIETGDFDSPYEVLWHSLVMFKESRLPKLVRLENLRSEIQKGIDDMKAGRFKTYSDENIDEFIEDIIGRGTEKLNRKNGEGNG